ncbi:MAG: hypothetical protein AAFU79_30280 [Myxococcota bacterium]
MARQRHEFRASWWIRGGVLAALTLWVGVGAWALLRGDLPLDALLGILFFVLFFVGFALYYWRMAYIVDDRGVTVRGHLFPWETIESVKRSTLPLVGWEVTTARGVFVLDVFVSGRARLLDVIVARAGLWPSTQP